MTVARNGFIALTILLYGAGVAHAQLAPAETPRGGAVTATDPMLPADTKAGLQLTAEQRSRIAQKVGEQKERVKPAPQEVNASVGAELPASMELYTVPDDIMIEIPATKVFKVALVRNDVVLVDPISMRVVDVIKR